MNATPLKQLKVRGPYQGPTGYDHAVREFIRGLARQGVEIELAGLAEWGPDLPPEQQDPWFDLLRRPLRADKMLHFCMPHQVRAEPGMPNVLHTMFEADRIPAFWADFSQQQDLIILPTESSKQAWVAGGIPETKIRLCPFGIDPALFATRRAPLELGVYGHKPLANYRVRFLNISALRPRKNLLGLLRTWISATSSDDDAALVLKLGCYQWGFYELFRRDVQDLQARLGKSLAEAAPIYVITQVMTYAEVLSLYAGSSHYISMSFGEGWDLPMMEAAASGLQLVAPYHSAYPAYLDESVVYWLPSRAVPVAFEGRMGWEDAYLFEGLQWWEPDETVAAQLIRNIIDQTIPPKASARDQILTTFTWEHAARRLIEILSQCP